MMKILHLTFSILLIALGNTVNAQQTLRIDTISTYDVNLSDYMTTNGRVYLANGKVISKEKYLFYKDNWERVQNCQPCEVYTYNDRNQLKHVAIQYGECLVGPFKEYYSDGKIKVEGSFRENPSSDWSNLRLRGLCSVRDGEWKYYSTSGKLEAIENYQNGKMISREEIKDTESKPAQNALNKMKGFFKKPEE